MNRELKRPMETIPFAHACVFITSLSLCVLLPNDNKIIILSTSLPVHLHQTESHMTFIFKY